MRLWRARLPLTCLASPSRNLEQEISFDFGPDGEFAYLYSQCYELTTNECAPPPPPQASGVGGGAWARTQGSGGQGLP